MDKLLTLKECADLLQVSVPTIYRRIADGSLPKPVKLGNLTRVRESEFLASIGRLGHEIDATPFDGRYNALIKDVSKNVVGQLKTMLPAMCDGRIPLDAAAEAIASQACAQAVAFLSDQKRTYRPSKAP